MYKFAPSAKENMEELYFRAYMVETAWDYYVTAHKGEHIRGYIKTNLSCLSLEILLKSFNADIVENEGDINEKYKTKNKAHNLIKLYKSLPPGHQNYLFNQSNLATLEKHKDLFSSSRYAYERNAPWTFDDSISKLAVETICKVVYLYKCRGSTDPFIINFNVDEVYFSDVQKVLIGVWGVTEPE